MRLARVRVSLQHNNETNNRKNITMKFMITWQFHQGKLHEGYSQFFKMTPAQDAADRGSRIKLIGRWHDLARGRGVIICESDSAEAVANWALNWNTEATGPHAGELLLDSPLSRSPYLHLAVLHRMREGVTPEGHYSWLELADFTGPREVAKVLQMKIQEAILAAALMDADQPVPPAYKELVEKYYRTLSDDLK